jgi:hypothetical protein
MLMIVYLTPENAEVTEKNLTTGILLNLESSLRALRPRRLKGLVVAGKLSDNFRNLLDSLRMR